jgi:replicative DNA helicase
LCASKARQLKARYGIEVVILDGIYTQTTGIPSLDENDNKKFSAIIEQNVYYAGLLDLVLMMTHQINRDAAKRKNKRPKKEDLYYSGKIEQLVTAGIFLYREVLDKPDTPHPNQAELIVDFNRDGAPGTIYSYFDTTRMQFLDAAKPRIQRIDPGFLAGDR